MCNMMQQLQERQPLEGAAAAEQLRWGRRRSICRGIGAALETVYSNRGKCNKLQIYGYSHLCTSKRISTIKLGGLIVKIAADKGKLERLTSGRNAIKRMMISLNELIINTRKVILMGKNHNSHKSMAKQVQDALDARLAIGQSKYAAKRIRLPDGRTEAQTRIYSWSTYRTYLKECNYFTTWCKEHYGCRTLQQCHAYVDEWLQGRIDAGLSAYTIKLDVSALAKLYDVPAPELTQLHTPSRARRDITRSRGDKVRDAHFSEEKNAALVAFCRSTGLRRSELEQLRGCDFEEYPDGAYMHVHGGKGGRDRLAPVVGDVELVRRICAAAGDGLVWGRVHSAADIHSYRRDYAQAVYDVNRRPDADIPKDTKNRYYCRGDRAGKWFDRPAMLAASRALGHNRVSVVGEHYLSHG